MSKIGKKPIEIPEGVEITINGNEIKVKGPKGELSHNINEGVAIKQEDNSLILSIKDDNLKHYWGLNRSLVANMLEGVSKGYEKKLLIMGVGYGAQLQGTKLVLSLGHSHKINFELPTDVETKVEQDPKGNTVITLSGIDKQSVGQVAAKIREFRKPEPYKGKGVRYFDEQVKLKPGKAAAK